MKHLSAVVKYTLQDALLTMDCFLRYQSDRPNFHCVKDLEAQHLPLSANKIYRRGTTVSLASVISSNMCAFADTLTWPNSNSYL